MLLLVVACALLQETVEVETASVASEPLFSPVLAIFLFIFLLLGALGFYVYVEKKNSIAFARPAHERASSLWTSSRPVIDGSVNRCVANVCSRPSFRGAWLVCALLRFSLSSYTENQKRAQYGTGKVRCNDDKPHSACWLSSAPLCAG
jgi:hypothetical protein